MLLIFVGFDSSGELALMIFGFTFVAFGVRWPGGKADIWDREVFIHMEFISI